MALPHFLADPPRFLFFTGKGGVGKTSLACATAVRLAEQGRRTLLVSTDPASNLTEVLATTIEHRLTAIPTAPGLSAIEIDPEASADAYRDRILTPLVGELPEAEISAAREQLSGSCTTEVAAFDEFTTYLADPAVLEDFDHVVFDTAPTGHTIRLLQLPGAWSDFLATGTGDTSCLGPLAGLDKHRATYAAAVAALRDTSRTRIVLVTRAQPSALAEAARTAAELEETGIRPSHLVVNGLLPASPADQSDPLYEATRSREQAALASRPSSLDALVRDEVAFCFPAPVGVPALRSLLAEHRAEPLSTEPEPAGDDTATSRGTTDLAALVDDLEAAGHGLVLCMGKGGVGKTTVAAAIAVALADRGHPVHLSTTDPAAHLTSTLPEAVPLLTVSRIDPAAAIATYREHVMATKGRDASDAERAALAEDLRSPCNDEVAVFNQFAQVIREARRGFVVLDTAPTGHTLLLLDATGSYHRDMVRLLGPDKTGYRTPLMMLQDPTLTHAVIVATPEQTPVSEAAALHSDLVRAGITPWAWVVNASLAAARPASPLLRLRAAAEQRQLDRVEALADRVVVLPMLASEPVGHDRLASLVHGAVTTTS
ncbi:arsenical pump-driving ATPase [Nocardioides daeguensis]|uniref:Arsenical pump-driving ATPase n=1 Tax=Nocardioides daeguensis TaxID=908359 RepID=A0ABP6UTG2_9ACTN|nr:arsenical pump-driving ATPase [Nocardioides daeguensis]MBV6728275.1 arsenical pump-driving ATPase [Nocardioides daeguensis]MCR1773084.1 arsenical pump-driving ATPase [Nocardioides daeguensis]